jgi:hypothetical protein
MSAAIVLVAAAMAHPSLAATGTDARCDQSMDTPPMSPTDDGNLAIQVIDHGTATAAAVQTVPVEETAADSPKGPRVEIMLRRIFDEARARQPGLPEPDVEHDRSAPLAVDKTDGVEEPTAVLEAEPADSGAELPGFSSDELLRYRQQMFRTDI